MQTTLPYVKVKLRLRAAKRFDRQTFILGTGIASIDTLNESYAIKNIDKMDERCRQLINQCLLFTWDLSQHQIDLKLSRTTNTQTNHYIT